MLEEHLLLTLLESLKLQLLLELLLELMQLLMLLLARTRIRLILSSIVLLKGRKKKDTLKDL